MQLRFFTVLPLLGFAACNQDQAGVEVLDQTALGPAGPQGTLVMSQNPPTQPVSDPEQPMLVACSTDADCSNGTACAAGFCLYSCSSNADCAAAGLVCDFASQRCAQCVADANCPGGQACIDGTCGVASAPADDDMLAPADDTPEPAAAEPEPAGDDAPSDITVDGGASPETEPSPDAGMVQPVVEPEPEFDENGCSIRHADPCSEGIPLLTETQTVDADGAEFCAVPPAVLELATSPLTIGDTSSLPHGAEVRFAWTTDALHVFAVVTDPNVLPEAPKDTWSGDSLDVYVSSSGDVSGNLNDDGTPQLILAPPSPDGSRAASAMRFPAQEALTSGFAATTGGDGYVVELSYPWPEGATLAAGDTIRLNFAMNVREQACTDTSDLNNCRQYYGAFADAFPGGDSPCDNYSLLSGKDAEPWCDNRTWCEVTLRE